MNYGPTVAYFSMEIAFASGMPNYAGGLGVLAADMLMSASDMKINMAGITLLYHQDDNEYGFKYERYLTRRPETVEVEIEDRKVRIAIWQKEIMGRSGHVVPIFLLSSNLPENKKWDRDLTKHLYAMDRYTRLGQEIILGIGGVRALDKLGYKNVAVYHLNEGHAAFTAIELLRKNNYDENKVRSLVTFTTHTPVAAGHDYFDYNLAGNTLREMMPWNIRDLAGRNSLGMTELAMNLSKSVNSVSERHKKVCQGMFPGREIKNVTNGIYAPRWAGKHMHELYNIYLSGWDENPAIMNEATSRLPSKEFCDSRQKEKKDFVHWVNFNKLFFPVSNVNVDDYIREDSIIIGFARRFVPYKRPDLIFRDLERLARLGEIKPIQLVFANRCHSNDSYCNDLRNKMNEYGDVLRGKVKIVLIPDYDLRIARHLVSAVDIWLNTPVAPLEASGTSGMKAALNGALNLSTRDGWWIEGLEHEPKSGWCFGGTGNFQSDEERDRAEACELMDRLEEAVNCFYNKPDEWTERSKHAIAMLGFFNTHRVVEQYAKEIWQS